MITGVGESGGICFCLSNVENGKKNDFLYEKLKNKKSMSSCFSTFSMERIKRMTYTHTPHALIYFLNFCTN